MPIEYDPEQGAEVTRGGEAQMGSVRRISKGKISSTNQLLLPYIKRSLDRSPAYAGVLDELEKEVGSLGDIETGLSGGRKNILIALKNILSKKFEGADVGKAKFQGLIDTLNQMDLDPDNMVLGADQEQQLAGVIDDAIEGFGQLKTGRGTGGGKLPEVGTDADALRKLQQERDAFRLAAEKERKRSTGMKAALKDTTERAKAGEEGLKGYKNLQAMIGDAELSKTETLTDTMLKKAGIPKAGWEAARMIHQQARANSDLAMKLKGQTDIATSMQQELDALKAKPAEGAAPTPEGGKPATPEAEVKPGKWATAKQRIVDFLMPTESIKEFGEGIKDLRTSRTPEYGQLRQLAQQFEGGGLADEAATLRGTDKTAIKELLDWMREPGTFTGKGQATRRGIQSSLQAMAPEAVAALEKGIPKAAGGIGRNIGKIAKGGLGVATSLPADLLAFIATPWALSQLEQMTNRPMSWESQQAERVQALQPNLDDAIVALKRDEFEQELAMKSMRENPDMLAAVQRQMQSQASVRAGTTPHETRIGGSSEVTGANPLDIFGGN